MFGQEMGSAAPPKEADAVVIGGGIIGCATGYYLAKRGLKVVLCEKGRIAGEQSSRNWGFVRQQGRDPREMPVIMNSLRLWRGLEAELDDDLGWHQGGVLYLGSGDKDMKSYEDWLEIARQHGLDTRLLSAAEVGNSLGLNAHPWVGGLETPSDGRAEPAKAAPAIARGLERLGGTVLTGCAVRGIETAAGRVLGVVTEKGPIRAPRVVCAAGAWSSYFNGNLGRGFPQLKVRTSVARTSPAPAFTERAVWADEVSFRRRQDGGFTISGGHSVDAELVPDSLRYFNAFLPLTRMSWRDVRLRMGARSWYELRRPRHWGLDEVSPFERLRVLDPAPDNRRLDGLLANAKRLFPALSDSRLVERWAGLIDVTPDAIPVMGPVEGIDGYFIAAGFSGHGFGIGPGAGHAMAGLVAEGDAGLDLSPFRLSRFFDGTKPEPFAVL